MCIKIGSIRFSFTYASIPLLIIISIAYFPVSYALNQLVNKFVQYGAWWDSAICMGIYLLSVLNALPKILKRQSYFTLSLLVISGLVFLVTIAGGLDGSVYASENAVTFFSKVFPFVFMGIAIREFDELDKGIEAVTKVVLVASIIWILIVVFDLYRNIRTPYMQISYYVLPSCLFRIYYYFRERSIKNLLWMILGILCHIIWGTRGPILFVMLFLAICLMWSSKSNKRFFVALLLIVLGIVLYAKMYDILYWANDFLSKYGLRNGGILKMLSEDLSDGRSDLFAQIMPYIDSHFVLGGGIYADRAAIGVYIHLLPLELICDFGIIIGLTMFLILTYIIVKRAISIHVFNDFRWAVLWVSIIVGYGKLFLSSTYLEDPFFFFLLGLLANCKMKNYLSSEEPTYV